MSQSFNLGNLLKQAGTGGADDCPTGECTIEVVSAEDVNSGNGKPMLKLKTRIVDGPYAGRTVFDNVVLTEDNPDAMVFFFAKLDALGLADPELLGQCAGTLKPLALAAPGRRARVNLVPREWPKSSGRFRPNVDSYLGRAEGGSVADDELPGGDAPADGDFGF